MRYSEIIKETSSAGATGASSVASVTGGFDPNGMWRSVYSSDKKKKQSEEQVIISRPMVEQRGIDQAELDDFAASIKDRFNLRKFNLRLSRGNIELSMMEVDPTSRGKGVGSSVMDELTDFADSKGLTIVLTPAIPSDNIGTTSRNRLIHFYKRFGFVENKGKNKDFAISAGMIRYPALK